jgi:riboflavin synthase
MVYAIVAMIAASCGFVLCGLLTMTKVSEVEAELEWARREKELLLEELDRSRESELDGEVR